MGAALWWKGGGGGKVPYIKHLGGIRDLCHMPVGVTYNTSCNHKHCTLTVTSTRTYYPTSERRRVTIRSSYIYPANKENTAHFHLWRNIQAEELTVACSPRGESWISHRPTNTEWANGLVIQLFRLPVHKQGYYYLPYALYAIVVQCQLCILTCETWHTKGGTYIRKFGSKSMRGNTNAKSNNT